MTAARTPMNHVRSGNWRCEVLLNGYGGKQCMTYRTDLRRVAVVASSEKRRALQDQGAWNPQPEVVRAEPFASQPEFFDAEDRLQVRYELLRAPAQGELTVTDACRLYGVSRQTFYTLKRAFEAHGIAGLIEQKRGRKGPVKASVEVVEFVRQARAEDPTRSGAELARDVQARFGISLHRRTVERLMSPKSSGRPPARTAGR